MRRVAIVLHTHLPYVRRNGTWPCGEDFFHQAAAESYLPLIGAFERLADAGLRDACTVAITPVLAHQMADRHMLAELSLYLGREELRAMRQVANYRGWGAREIKDLAAFYARRGREHEQRLRDHGTIAAAFATLERAGVVELGGGPATHPLLTRISSERLRRAQLRAGLDEHQRIFGRRPATTWIPECAVGPGTEESLGACGIERVVVDPAATAGSLVPVTIADSGVGAFPFDRSLTGEVWSPDGGYPAGEWYRDFHAWDLEAGFKNWRVTDRAIGWLGKQPYDPAAAARAARADAGAFVAALERAFDQLETGLLVAAFDTELLGHW
ncbi:MAG: 1,4-alpha-glucan branching protein, partial [Actinomycetota bacterium]